LSGRSREELERIRRANRAALGLAGTDANLTVAEPPLVRAHPAGMAGGVPGMGAFPAGLIPTIRVGSAFPKVDYTYDPSQPSAPATGEAGWVSDFINRSIVRPFVEVGPVRYSPGDGYPDFSGIAAALAALAAVLGAGAAAYVIYRAFAPRSLS
jgi:hypothetical protein